MHRLVDLERELHQAATPADVRRLYQLLHESFVEYGRSGRVYDRDEMIQGLSSETTPAIWVGDFSVSNETEEAALVTYRSAQINEQGAHCRHALRSPLWIRANHRWQMRFHQDTPTEPIATQERRNP